MSVSSYPPPTGGGVVDFVFWFSGTLQTNQTNLIPKVARRQSCDVDLLEVFLQAAPTGQAVLVSFYKNAVSIGQVSVAAGAVTGSLSIAATHFAAEDICTATIDQVGSMSVGVTMTAYARVRV